MAKLKLSPPWVSYYKKLDILFGNEDGTMVIFDEDETEVKIYTNDTTQAMALSALLPMTISFGGVELKVTVIPPNEDDIIWKGFGNTVSSPQAAIEFLFSNNKNVNTIKHINTPFGELTYIIFNKEVVQYYDDNLGDYYGNRSMLCEDIAREIFTDIRGVYFCTSIE